MLKRSSLLAGINANMAAYELFRNPACLPTQSSFYGAVSTKGFRLSPIVFHDGKPWQLRTIAFNEKHYIAPFSINSGGVNSRSPIIGTPMLQKIGAINGATDREAWRNDEKLVALPTPLGELVDISDWDIESKSSNRLDVRYNLIGHGFAFFIRDVDSFSALVLQGVLSFGRAVRSLIRDCPDDLHPYIRDDSNNRWRIERELDAMIEAKKLWKCMKLPQIAEEWAK